MAEVRHATVVATRALAPLARELELEPDVPLPFVGGQFVIVDTGLTAPGGKRIKRAYSMVSSDASRRLSLIVRRHEGGAGSAVLHDLAPGARLAFSGPWGKLVPPPGSPDGDVLIVATHTGVTAALGLWRGAGFATRRPRAHVIWARPYPGYFLPDAWVRAAFGLDVGIVTDVARLPEVAECYLAGDGARLDGLAAPLVAAGAAVWTESFFNHVVRKAA